jgi:hypothetical protein
VGEAIEMTQKLYPGLLERNQNLLFLLKCRQFVEMVSGHDSEVRGPGAYSPSRSNKSSPCSSPTHPHSSSSGGNSLNSSPHSSNGFVSNGVQNGVGRDVETLMEIEEEHEAEIPRNGVLNGSASQGEISCSPRRGNPMLFSTSTISYRSAVYFFVSWGRLYKKVVKVNYSWWKRHPIRSAYLRVDRCLATEWWLQKWLRVLYNRPLSIRTELMTSAQEEMLPYVTIWLKWDTNNL